MEVLQFPGGHANLTYLARFGERELVLRRPPLGPVAPSSHDMAREYKVLSRLHERFAPAHRAFALCGDAGVKGAIFGVIAGTAYVFIAATIGACGAFLVARYFVRKSIEARLAGNEKFAAIDRAIAGEGRKITFLLRLSPVFPFNLLNYALGLTRVGFADSAIDR